MKNAVKAVVFAGLALVIVFGVAGCGKEPADSGDHAGHNHDEAAAGAIEQKVCPVMGGDIDKNVFLVHEGKKVYFCCPGCEDAFKADPEKYMSKLPQFKK